MTSTPTNYLSARGSSAPITHIPWLPVLVMPSGQGRAGNPGAARDLITALLPVRERVLGPDHPYILSTRAELAHWTGEAGNHAGARDQYVALLPVSERVLGPDHTDTISIRIEFIRWTSRASGSSDHSAHLDANLKPRAI